MAQSSGKQPWPKVKGSDPEEDSKAASVRGTCFGYNVGEGIGLKGTDPSPPSHFYLVSAAARNEAGGQV